MGIMKFLEILYFFLFFLYFSFGKFSLKKLMFDIHIEVAAELDVAQFGLFRRIDCRIRVYFNQFLNFNLNR